MEIMLAIPDSHEWKYYPIIQQDNVYITLFSPSDVTAFHRILTTPILQDI